MALLATLFFSRGTIMLTAGDEFGRSQQGNNNAYAQDNRSPGSTGATVTVCWKEFTFAPGGGPQSNCRRCAIARS